MRLRVAFDQRLLRVRKSVSATRAVSLQEKQNPPSSLALVLSMAMVVAISIAARAPPGIGPRLPNCQGATNPKVGGIRASW